MSKPTKNEIDLYLRKQYLLLEIKVIKNYEDGILDSILEDLKELEDHSEYYFIDDHDEFLHNLGIAMELNEIIEYLIFENYENKVIKKFLRLKRITDLRISNYKDFPEQAKFAEEYVFGLKENNNNFKSVIELNHNQKNQKEVIKNLYNLLYEANFIKCSYDDFKVHFDKTENWSSKIVWLSTDENILFIITTLFNKQIFPPTKIRKLKIKTITDHFKKESQEFNKFSLRSTASNLVLKERKFKEIKKLINKHLKINFD